LVYGEEELDINADTSEIIKEEGKKIAQLSVQIESAEMTVTVCDPNKKNYCLNKVIPLTFIYEPTVPEQIANWAAEMYQKIIRWF